MSGKQAKNDRRRTKKQVGRDNQRVFHAFMLEISAHPFWQRFWFCLLMAFKRHALQKSMKDAIAERKRLLKAQKIATGQHEHRALKFVIGFSLGTAIVVGIGLLIFMGGG